MWFRGSHGVVFRFLVFFSALHCSAGHAEDKKPRVAVFNIESKAADLSSDVLNRLTEYLASSLAATGTYQVVPRAQIKERLVQQKKESYKSCYDQKCQIEIGREIAANKSLSTQIIKIGSECLVIAVMYDLRRAASEGGARADGGCTEQEILKSLKKVLEKLVPAQREEISDKEAAAIKQTIFPVKIQTSVAGAKIYINGKFVGESPVDVDIKRGKQEILTKAKGYLDQRKEIHVFSPRTVSINLYPNF